ncbi:MAG: hypothetical protein M3456_07495 [Actinomycetota bacterium]|nr:hypothetical protein [Actinomycetota bacterium]
MATRYPMDESTVHDVNSWQPLTWIDKEGVLVNTQGDRTPLDKRHPVRADFHLAVPLRHGPGAIRL